MLENMKQEIGEKPGKLVMDSGYANMETAKNCRAHEVEPVCSALREQTATAKKGKEKRDSIVERLTYDAEKGEFCCCHGKGSKGTVLEIDSAAKPPSMPLFFSHKVYYKGKM